ncbi:hypothetical protein [Pandoraea vervacti]|nr:hypothetical protein [Pandoraea vervacti]
MMTTSMSHTVSPIPGAPQGATTDVADALVDPARTRADAFSDELLLASHRSPDAEPNRANSPVCVTTTLHYYPDASPRTGPTGPQTDPQTGRITPPPMAYLDRSDSPILSTVAQRRLDGVSRSALRSLEPEIRKFLLDNRIGGIGSFAMIVFPVPASRDAAHPCDTESLSVPNAFYTPSVASRKVLDLDARDLQPVETAPADMTDVGLEELGIAPPVHPPADAPRTDPAAREIIPKVYRQLLGRSAVFQTHGKWNIGTSYGVVAMQREMHVTNLMVVMFGTASSTFLYFAQDIDPHQTTAPILPIEWLMNTEEKITEGALTIVDARRRVLRATARPGGSAFAHTSTLAPTISVSTESAEQVIARAIVLDVGDTTIVTRVLASRIVDADTRSTDMLLAIRNATGRAIDYTFLREAGVRVANSHLAPINGLQALAVVFEALRHQVIVGHSASLKLTARKLLEPNIVSTLACAMKHAHSDSKATAELFGKVTVGYLQLLTSLMADGVLESMSVWSMLKTIPGQFLTSMLAVRARYDAAPARAFVRIADQFFIQEVFLTSIRGTFFASTYSQYEGFYREICAAASSRDPGAAAAREIRDELEAKSFACRTSAKSRISRKNREELFRFPFGSRSKTSHNRRKAEDMPSESAVELLDGLCTLLCRNTFDQIEKSVLEDALRTDMPTLPCDELRNLRETMTSALEREWRKVLPDDAPPRGVTRSVLETDGKTLGRAIAEARRPARDHIVQEAGEAYVEYLRTHPEATANERVDVRTQLIGVAKAEYEKLIREDSRLVGTSAQVAVASGGQQALASAQTVRAQRVVAADVAASAATGAPLGAKTRVEQTMLQLTKINETQAAQRARDAAFAKAIGISHVAGRAVQTPARRKLKRVAVPQPQAAAKATAAPTTSATSATSATAPSWGQHADRDMRMQTPSPLRRETASRADDSSTCSLNSLFACADDAGAPTQASLLGRLPDVPSGRVGGPDAESQRSGSRAMASPGQ